jgi:hypothetical protein
MKRIYAYLALAVAMILASSCQKDDDTKIVSGDEITMDYSVNIEAATKAYGNGDAVNYVWYAIYKIGEDQNGNETLTFAKSFEPAQVVAGSADCRVTMMRGQSYRVVFVAQHYDVVDGVKVPVYPIDKDYGILSMPNNPKANSDNYDVFYGVDDVIAYDGKATSSVTLNRIVAQVNFYPDQADWDAANSLSMQPVSSSMKVSGLAKSFDLWTGTFSDETVTVNFEKAPILSSADRHVASFYGLANDVVKINLYLYTTPADPYVRDVEIANVPAKANMKTNIKGMMMTGTLDYTITLNTDYHTKNN